jgi:hypothetical protein
VEPDLACCTSMLTGSASLDQSGRGLPPVQATRYPPPSTRPPIIGFTGLGAVGGIEGGGGRAFPGVVGGIEGGGGGAFPGVVGGIERGGGGAFPGVEVMVSVVVDEGWDKEDLSKED